MSLWAILVRSGLRGKEVHDKNNGTDTGKVIWPNLI